MRSDPTRTAARAVLPPQSFSWAVLETASLPKGPGHRRRLDYLLEAVLPIPVEDVHAEYIPAGSGRVLACAMNRDALFRARDDGCLTLSPESIPEFLGVGIDAFRINLLQGPFEPPKVRAARRRWMAQMVLLLAVAAALLVIGLERRIRDAERQRDAALAAADQLYRQILPAGASRQPSSLRLTAELRQLRQTRSDTPDLAVCDASGLLADLLAHWPTPSQARASSFVLTPEAATLLAVVADHTEAQSLASALGETPGWTARQPQVGTAKGAVQLTVRLVRESASIDKGIQP